MDTIQQRLKAVLDAAFALPEQDRDLYLSRACHADLQVCELIVKFLESAKPSAHFPSRDPPLADSQGAARCDLASSHPGDASVDLPTVISERVAEGAEKLIGRYRLIVKLGEGGMGEVWMAEKDTPMRQHVALKLIKVGMDTKSVTDRFAAEGKALALMDHPNIARVFEAGATDAGRPYLAMELVRGIKITEFCDQNELAICDRLELFIKVCHAVQHAHQKGIIHRDLKPSNVLVAFHERVPEPKVIDFGVAMVVADKLSDKTPYTELQALIGTPAYMSPEQAGRERMDIDTRSDIYSLGVLLYELLTGKTPFDTKDLLQSGLTEMCRIIRETEPLPLSKRLNTFATTDLALIARHRRTDPQSLLSLLQSDLSWIVMKTLAKDRIHRYATVNGLARDVQHHLRHEPVEARPPSSLYRLHKLVWRHKLAFASACGSALALSLGLALSLWQYLDKSHAYARTAAAEHEERIARGEAEKAEASESRQRKNAEAAAMRLAEIVDQMELRNAQEFFAAQETPEALATLALVLRRNPTNRVAVSQLMFALSQRHFPLPRVNPLAHENWVWAAHFSPDGRLLLTISNDQTARLWETSSGKLVATYAHRGNVPSAQFSPDGRYVATASEDKLVRIWDLHTRQCLPLPHESVVWFLRFSPDGRKLVTAAWDGMARLWDVQTGAQLTPPLRHKKKVYSASFSPDGLRVVTASLDGMARIWDAQSGALVGAPLQHPAKLWFAQFSGDGSKVVTACDDRYARVWNSETGELLMPPLPHLDAVYYAEFSPDSQLLVTASADHHARIFDLRTHELVATLRHASVVRSARFSPDGKRIVAASDDGTARIWSAPGGEPLMEPLRHHAEVWYAEFSPDGRQVATASTDGTAQLWDVTTDPAPGPLLRAPSRISAAEFSADGSLLLTRSKEGMVQVWNAPVGRTVALAVPDIEGVDSATWSPDGRSILTLSQAHGVRVSRRDSPQTMTLPLARSLQAISAAFTPDGTQIITASTRSDRDSEAESNQDSVVVQSWASATGHESASPFAVTGIFSALHVTTNHLWLLTISADRAARAWDVRAKQPIGGAFTAESGINFAQFSPDARHLLTMSTDNTLGIWNVAEGRPAPVLVRHADRVTSAQFSPDGQLVLTVAEHVVSNGQNARIISSVRVWDAKTGEMLVESTKHEGKVTAAQFTPDGHGVLTATSQKGAWLWDCRSGNVLLEILHKSAPVSSARLSPDGRRLVYVSEDLIWVSELEKFPVPVSAWLPDFAEALAGIRLKEHRAFESVPPSIFLELSQRLISSADEDSYTRWAQRFLGRQLHGNL